MSMSASRSYCATFDYTPLSFSRTALTFVQETGSFTACGLKRLSLRLDAGMDELQAHATLLAEVVSPRGRKPRPVPRPRTYATLDGAVAASLTPGEHLIKSRCSDWDGLSVGGC